jgi:hypothetical protein
MSLGTILLIILILLGMLPTWSHSRSWGYYPAGEVGTVRANATYHVACWRETWKAPWSGAPGQTNRGGKAPEGLVSVTGR